MPQCRGQIWALIALCRVSCKQLQPTVPDSWWVSVCAAAQPEAVTRMSLRAIATSACSRVRSRDACADAAHNCVCRPPSTGYPIDKRCGMWSAAAEYAMCAGAEQARCIIQCIGPGMFAIMQGQGHMSRPSGYCNAFSRLTVGSAGEVGQSASPT